MLGTSLGDPVTTADVCLPMTEPPSACHLYRFMIPGMLYLAMPGLHTAYALMLPAFALTTFGIGFIPPMVTALAMQTLGPERGGMISAVVNFFRQLAGAFGVAVFGLFMTSANDVVSYRSFGITLTAAAVVLLLSIGFFACAPKQRTPS